MKRFQFSLETILELRLEEEQEAEINLGKAVGEWNLLNEQKTQRLGIKARSRSAGPVSSADLLQNGLYLARIDSEIADLQSRMDGMEPHLEELRAAYREARAKREGLDKLKEKRRSEYKEAWKRSEAHKLDDLLNNMNKRERG
jgi:flagellar export protein FliJ